MAEYQCQYSDQVRKKHKSWHDGVLKYKSGQLILYIDDGGKLATVRKSSRELERILDPNRFGEELRLSSRYVVTIESALEQRPSLALKMKPFKATISNRPSRRRIPQLQHRQNADSRRSRIRHVETKPIVI